MSEKIWKIFGIFGIVCLVGIFLGGILISLGGIKRKTMTPAYFEKVETPMGIGGGLEKINLPSPETPPPSNLEKEIPSRMIIKTGWLNLVVKDIGEAIKKISKFVEENGGWVVSSNVYETEKIPSGSITVRVPAEKFDQAKDYFKSLAVRVSSESTQSQDITEEYVDLQSNLRNLEAAEEQLLEIMKRAGKINEVLDVYRELTNIRQQIEKIKGRMQYLEQSAKMSLITVNLALSEELLPIPPGEKWRPKYVFLQTWKSVLNFWKGFSYFLIKLVVWSQVWIPTLILVAVFIRIWRKKKRKV